MLRAGMLAEIDPVDLEVLAHAIVGAGEQVGRWWLDKPGYPRADAVERFESIALALIADTIRRGGA
jgi:hypothetical protein